MMDKRQHIEIPKRLNSLKVKLLNIEILLKLQ